MIFRAVGDRCAVDLQSLNLPITPEDSLRTLEREGFWCKKVSLARLLKKFIGRAGYRRGARMREAPYVFDCSSFAKWIYGFLGINLPRRSIQQFEACVSRQRLGPELVCPTDLRRSGFQLGNFTPGSLIFSRGTHPYTGSNGERIGHVGIVMDLVGRFSCTVAHAVNAEKGIVQEDFWDFKSKRGDGTVWVGRIAPDLDKLITVVAPMKWEVETSDDIRWILLQCCKEPG